MRLTRFVLLAALCLAGAFPVFAQDRQESAYDRVMRTGVIRCGYFSWPPFFEKDPASGEYRGVSHDVMEALGRVLNLKIEWSYDYALGQQVEALKTGKMDALCMDGPWTRSAVPFIDYSHPYMFIPGYVYVPEGNPKNLTLETLNAPDYTFTMMDGDGSAEILAMRFPKAKLLSMPSTADPSLLLENVSTGKADALFSDPASIAAQSLHNKARLVALSPEHPLASYPFVVSLPKGEQGLLNMLNQGIDVLNDTGDITQILKAHDPAGEKLRVPALRYGED
jgi:polar amino acid transport system substrate-binding protein